MLSMLGNNITPTQNSILNASFIRKVRGKQLLWGLVLIFVLTAAGAYLFWPPNKAPEAPLVAVKKMEKDSLFLTDEDGDGLLLWEEELYRTDPKKADTDGDEVPDGEEIKAGTDPLDITNKTPVSPANETSPSFRTQPSSNLTRSLFEEFVKEGGGELLLGKRSGDAAANLLSGKLEQYLAQGKFSARPPLQKSIPVRSTPDTSPQAVKNYLNALGGIFEKHILPLKEDDLSLFRRAILSADPALIAKIREYRQAMERATRELRALEVPENLTWFHIKEIQLFEETWRGLLAMERLEQDPLAALAALPSRREVKIEVIKLHYQELKNWLKDNGVALTSKEKAYRLMN